jgi:subtilase family serine protease
MYGGTSFAAPFVSGGLAVIADYFEGQLGSH